MTSARRGVDQRRRCRPRCRPAGASQVGGVEAMSVRVGSSVDQGGHQHELAVQTVVDEEVVDELDRPLVLHHRRHRPADRADPAGELVGVRDRGGQADEPDVVGCVDDHLLPHRTAVRVLEVVDLVEHDPREGVEGPGAGVDHVAEDLGGHHHDRRVTVDGVVPGQEADVRGAVAPDQVEELLVRQGLDRRGVERPLARRQRQLDGPLGHHGLARPGGRGDEDRSAVVDRRDRLDLEAVEDEPPPAVRGGRVGHAVSGVAVAAASAALRRRRSRIRPITIETS